MIWVGMKIELYRIDITGDNYFEKYFDQHMNIPYDHMLGSPVYDYMVLTYISTYDHTI